MLSLCRFNEVSYGYSFYKEWCMPKSKGEGPRDGSEDKNTAGVICDIVLMRAVRDAVDEAEQNSKKARKRNRPYVLCPNRPGCIVMNYP